jgi:hypothetical protein
VCSDTSVVIGYELYEAGRTVETFAAGNDLVTEFRSALRDAGVVDGGNVYRFVERFLLDHDVYEPGVREDYFLSDGRSAPTLVPGGRRTVRNPVFFLSTARGDRHSTPELERVDYLVFSR